MHSAAVNDSALAIARALTTQPKDASLDEAFTA